MLDSFFAWFENKLADATYNALRRGVERAKGPAALADATDDKPAPAIENAKSGRNGRQTRVAAD